MVMKKSALSLKVFSIASVALISGCGGLYNDYNLDNPDPIDRPTGLNRKDFIETLTPAPKQEKVTLKQAPIPKMSDVLTAPKAPKIASDKTVTVSVTEDVQLKDVFLELSRLADIDIEVDPRIQGGVIFKAKDRPISEVLERITEMAGLKYSVNGGVVRIENDNPFIKTYQASFLNIIRSNTSEIGVNTKLGSSGSGGGAGGGGGGGNASSNGSQSSIKYSSGGTGDIWATLEKEITSIAKSSSPASGRPQFAPPAPGAAVPVIAPGAPGAPAAAPAPVAAAPAAAAGDTFVSLNREAGVITVKATERNQAKVKEYLDKVKYYYSSQVLIEAKVVEVALNDQFKSGIDWKIMAKNGGINAAVPGFPTPDLGGDSNIYKFNFTRGNGDIEAAVDLAQIFGTTRTLSSPRILAMNNQQAILSFARNENYFTIECTQEDPVLSNGDVQQQGKLEVTSELNTVPVGVILALQASIDNENNEIMMSIRPTLSRLTGESVTDPATAICLATAAAQSGDSASLDNITADIPQVDIREMDSILKLKNGEVMVIGGMIEQNNENTDSGLPWFSEVPLLGNVFKTVDKENRAIQTVIFLKATIVPGYGVDGSDQNFYKKFNTDPRPFSF